MITQENLRIHLGIKENTVISTDKEGINFHGDPMHVTKLLSLISFLFLNEINKDVTEAKNIITFNDLCNDMHWYIKDIIEYSEKEQWA